MPTFLLHRHNPTILKPAWPLRARCLVQGLSRALACVLLVLALLGLASFAAAQASPGDTHRQLRVSPSSTQPTRRFWVWKDMFLKDGRPFRILSGSIHYHRWGTSSKASRQ